MGNALSGLEQMYPPKAKWGVDQIPDLTGQVMIVTGGATGVGKETVKALLTHNAKVYIATRNEQKANAAIEQLKESTGKEAIFLHLDLADLASVKKAAQEFLSAVMACPMDQLTVQGYDMQIGTNVIGHHLFTELLLPALFAATESGKHGKARVVTTSSSAVYIVNELKYETFRDGKERRAMATYDMYNLSKFANVIEARELARRYGDKIVSISVNPGNLQTELQRHLTGLRKFLIDRILYPAPHGALTQLWGGTAPETADYNGKFLIPWARLGKANPATEDPKAGEKLWNWLEEQVKDFKN
ncbi:hypothetical protein EWM64_g3722 [Hericium alpestre]|uniref:NAD(P)-binding protein n=1 Tax=Hericium alpestre TaxID=135208 RepID=A0A4Y9ZZI8_9AGAM|nr:hypothetical protein EWM64_g3722 [Hericium alpestre]